MANLARSRTILVSSVAIVGLAVAGSLANTLPGERPAAPHAAPLGPDQDAATRNKESRPPTRRGSHDGPPLPGGGDGGDEGARSEGA